MPTDRGPQRSLRHRVRRRLGAGVLVLVILLAVGRLLFFDLWEGKDVFMPPQWDGKPRFWETAYPRITAPPNASIWRRLTIAFSDFQRRHGGKNPTMYSFAVQSNQLCSVRMSLTQCMEVAGTKYLIAQEVALVEFGHNNVLNGAQWVVAFEGALQTNQPQCLHPSSNGLWGENLLLIREKSGVVKVVPPSRLADYQKAGLVDRRYKPEIVQPSVPNNR